MPDQHAAATEHQLISSVTEPLSHLPEDPLGIVAADFPIALRGYDRIAVDAYVEHTTQLIAELQSTRSPEAAVRRALQRVGEEISGILQRAHETADEITARSRAEAEERLETARREAVELTADAERRVAALDAETERMWAERHSIVTDARGLASRLLALAEEASSGAAGTVPVRPFDADADEPLDGPASVGGDTTAETVPVEPAGGWGEPGADEGWGAGAGWADAGPGAYQGWGAEADLAPDEAEPVGAQTPGETAAAESWAEPAQPAGAGERGATDPVAADPWGRTADPAAGEPAAGDPWARTGDPAATDPAADPAAAADPPVDQPTAPMPPLAPWEGEDPGSFDARRR